MSKLRVFLNGELLLECEARSWEVTPEHDLCIMRTTGDPDEPTWFSCGYWDTVTCEVASEA